LKVKPTDSAILQHKSAYCLRVCAYIIFLYLDVRGG